MSLVESSDGFARGRFRTRINFGTRDTPARSRAPDNDTVHAGNHLNLHILCLLLYCFDCKQHCIVE